MQIPKQGTSADDVLTMLEQRRANDVDWRAGRCFTYVYDAGQDVEQLCKQAYMAFLSENALDPTFFPSAMVLENELVSMVGHLVGGNASTVGTFTSGGTESILLAVKTAREHFRARHGREVTPEMLIPVTAHAAFHKACQYFDLKPVTAGVDSEYRADIADMQQKLCARTMLIVASAPSYAHGVIDPVRAIAALAQANEVPLHVDACLGGVMLPFMRMEGASVPAFGFDVPGVTSLSVDLHKYGFAGKGASLVFYRDKAWRRAQVYSCADWPGYALVNTTICSSRSVGPIAGAWAVMRYLGQQGYRRLARSLIEGTARLCQGIEAIEGLRVLAPPDMCLLAFSCDQGAATFHLADELKLKGWHVLVQFGFAGAPANIHLSVNPANVAHIDAFIADLRQCTQLARERGAGALAKMVQGTFAQLDPADVSDETIARMASLAGVTGTTLPPRMAEVNEILDALPKALAERLLTSFINDMFTPDASERADAPQ